MSDAGSSDEYLKFERVPDKLSSRPDLHALILLDRLVPGTVDILSGAEHDVVSLAISADELAARATSSQLQDLLRCGVHYNVEYDCLEMFV